MSNLIAAEKQLAAACRTKAVSPKKLKVESQGEALIQHRHIIQHRATPAMCADTTGRHTTGVLTLVDIGQSEQFARLRGTQIIDRANTSDGNQ